jgi:hypothetical protein
MNVRTLSTYVLRALAQAQLEGRRSNLETLVAELSVRRRDIRGAVSALHQQGLLDVLRMRLTMTGFILGRSYIGEDLPALRAPVLAAANAA